MNMRKVSRSFIGATAVIGIGLVLANCGGSKRETSSNVTSDAVTNLGKISDSFAPSSLTYSSSTLNALRYSPQTGPCDATGDSGVTGLFSCQPILLRIYVGVAKQFLDYTKDIVSNAGTSLGALGDGASGTATTGDGSTIVYSKTSSTKYSLIVKQGENSLAYVDVDGSNYTLKIDFSKMSDMDSGAPGQFEAVVSYTDDNNWSVRATALNMECSADDVRAPRRMRVLMSKVDGLWKGKAIIYNDVWAHGISSGSGDPTCSTTGTDATSMALLTDFVGDSTAAKAKVYMTTRVADSSSDIEAAPLNAFCSTYGISSTCTSLGIDLSSYSNPFCNKSDTIAATWNDSCASTSSSVASASFGASSDWTTPADFASTTTTAITLPTSL